MKNWTEIFKAAAVPEWFQDFDLDPFEAVDAALWRRYYFGNLNAADPADLLIDWARGIGNRNDFIGRLDNALAQWVHRTWGQKPEPDGQKSRAMTAMAWLRLGEVVAHVDALQKAPRALRQYFDDRENYLEPLCQGPSRDPLGSYLYAVARHQEDRSLESVWWNYCDLVAGIPHYHGLYGVWGLRRLPPATEAERGRFRKEVAEGLARLAVGLHRRSLDGSLSSDEAQAEFKRVAHLTLAAYPFPERWREYWSSYISSVNGQNPEPIKWMRELVPQPHVEQPQITKPNEANAGNLAASGYPFTIFDSDDVIFNAASLNRFLELTNQPEVQIQAVDYLVKLIHRRSDPAERYWIYVTIGEIGRKLADAVVKKDFLNDDERARIGADAARNLMAHSSLNQ